MACKRCKEFRETYALDDEGYHRISSIMRMGPIRCAFEEKFSDNWGCMTLTDIRDFCSERGNTYRTEDESFYILPFNGKLIILQSYKSRGHTRFAYILSFDGTVKNISLDDLEEVIDFYKIPKSYEESEEWDLFDADPNCKHEVVDAPGGGVKCKHCSGWFCY